MKPLPEKVDLRHLCGPVYDQGELGCSCGCDIAMAFNFEENRGKSTRRFLYYKEKPLDPKKEL